jgi:hypothetical protein
MANTSPTTTKHVLNVDVIVTYKMNPMTVGALMKADEAGPHPLMSIAGTQARMSVDIGFDAANTTYDEVMDAVVTQVRRRTKKVVGLGANAITKISTCADWNKWDSVTGRKSEAEAVASTKWQNGKRHF